MLVGSPRVLLAPDKFKGTLPAREVAACLAEGIGGALRSASTTLLPVADGGDGTLDVALAAGYTPVEVMAVGPLGHPNTVRIATRGRTAVIELASVCGLHAATPGAPRPELATTRGLGLAMRAALELGFRRLIVGLGGSASTDGGAGMLVGLGARLLDGAGADVEPSPRRLAEVRHIDLSTVTPALTGAELVFAVDVDAPLLGAGGAARVFGPQKGAGPAEVVWLEEVMTHWTRLIHDAAPRADAAAPGAGAAGGAGFAGLALGARLRSGSDLCLDLSGFDEVLRSADVVVTGEGRLDRQTLLGKAPFAVAARARSAQVPVIAVVGSRSPDLSDRVLAEHGFGRVYTLVDEAPDAANDAAISREALRAVGRRLATDICQSISK